MIVQHQPALVSPPEDIPHFRHVRVAQGQQYLTPRITQFAGYRGKASTMPDECQYSARGMLDSVAALACGLSYLWRVCHDS